MNRRLVRQLKGNGRLAVYIPDAVEPDAKAFRLYRAIAHLIASADAKVVPIVISRRALPALLEPAAGKGAALQLAQAHHRGARGGEARWAGGRRRARPHRRRQRTVRPPGGRRVKTGVDRSSLFQAMRDAALVFGPSRTIIEDAIAGALTYRELFAGARILGRRFEAFSAPGEAVGLLLPSSNGIAMSLIGLLSGGRVAAMINHTAGPANVTSAIRTAVIRTVVSSRAFIEKADIADIVVAVEAGRGETRLAGGRSRDAYRWSTRRSRSCSGGAR